MPRTRMPVHPWARAAQATVVAALIAACLVAIGVGRAEAAAPSTLSRGQRLTAGASLVAPDGRTRLVMQGGRQPRARSPTAALWSTRTSGRPGAQPVVQGDGNLVLYDAAGADRWWTGTKDVASLTVQSDGNLVARTALGVARWASGTDYPPASAGPWRSSDGRFTAGMEAGGNVVLRYAGSATPDALWSTGTSGHPRAWLAAQSDGNLVVRENGRVLWASGTNGHPDAVPGVTSGGDLVIAGSRSGVVWRSATAGATGGLDGPSADPRFTKTWTHVLGGPGSTVALSSPGVGPLDAERKAVVFGTRSAQLYAYHVSDGSTVPGWPVGTGGVAVDSTPAVSGSGATARVFVGLGSSGAPAAGGYAAYGPNGQALWTVRPNAILQGGGTVGVMSSLAVGNLQTGNDVIGGAMGLMGYATNAAGGVLRGFPFYEGDTNFSTPALADLDGDGRDEAIMGGDSSVGPAFGRNWTNGGHIRIVRNTGAAGQTSPAAATSCDYVTNQVVQTSPAVGRIFGGGKIGIVSGTGTWFAGASDTDTVFALDAACHVIWRTNLDGASIASPSLIDVDRNGTLEVVTASSAGTLYVLDGATGRVRTATAIHGRILGQVTSIEVAGRRSLLVGHTSGVTVLDAATGTITGQLAPGVAVQSTVTITLDPGGLIGVTVVGLNAQNRGVALHFQLTGATATTVSGPGQWPMFHRDPKLRGSTLG